MKIRNLGYAAVVAVAAAAFVIGSVDIGEAKGKKKKAAAAAPATMGVCIEADSPTKYCAVKGGMKFTYVNKCVAKNDGAKIISNKACPAPKAMKAMKGGGKKAKKADKKAKK
jgi:hypothetical protein